MDDSFREIISTTRSIRRIRPDIVPDDVLERVLQAAVWAPSGGNRQPWKMIVVRDTDTKRRLGEIYATEWEKYVEFNLAAIASLEPAVREKRAAALHASGEVARNLAGVPVVVVFVHDPSRLMVTDEGLGRPSVVGGASLYPAVQNLLLAARAEGLGGVLTTLIARREDEVREILGFPAGWGLHAMVPLGWPQGRHGPLNRLPLSAVVHHDRWSE